MDINLKHLRAFVIGMLYEQLGNIPNEFYLRDTMEITHGYLLGVRVLDGYCSDYQCYVATEAAKLFRPE